MTEVALMAAMFLGLLAAVWVILDALGLSPADDASRVAVLASTAIFGVLGLGLIALLVYLFFGRSWVERREP